MTLLNKEPVKRAEKCLKDFDENLSVVELKDSAKTAFARPKPLAQDAKKNVLKLQRCDWASLFFAGFKSCTDPAIILAIIVFAYSQRDVKTLMNF